MEFRLSRADNSLFIRGTKHDITYVAVYVDDILVTGSSEKYVNEVKKQLHDRFSLKDLGLLHYFLGFEAVYTSTGMFLSQKKYVQELLTKFNVHAKPVDTLLPITPKLSSENAGAPVNAQQYRSAIGALLYVCHTRPDIAFAVHKVAQFMQSPCEAHWTGVKCILRYLKDWGSDTDDRRSVSGYCVYLGSHLLSWSSRKQRSVSRSTVEAEYRILVDTTTEVLWVKAVLDDMNIELFQAPVIWCDNTSTVTMVANPVLHAKVKHVDLDVHFVREKVMNQQLIVNYVPTNCQITDVLTKPLVTTRFQELCQKLNVFSLQRLQLHKNQAVKPAFLFWVKLSVLIHEGGNQCGYIDRIDPESFKACVPLVTHNNLESYIQTNC
ncbi:uncharacterized mitochondrial protein AtMg00810-like [Hibiscus syriacus]|uniref:uncharacterized mitochondrial protein AtMg00810-like n=1 Tax=Hibiscus syriacus TaxID=106335 RepID=UPI0019237D06|nr:uncharacterized mitochondrial protein AtMg00810-like [Hibiscus syriacus]